MKNGWQYVQTFESYIDYDKFVDVGDDSVLVHFRATWDSEENAGYVSLLVTEQDGLVSTVTKDFPSALTKEEFSALTGHVFEE